MYNSQLLAASRLVGLLTAALCLCNANAQQIELPGYLEIDAGPGSAQPRLSQGPSGTIILSWLEPHDDLSLLRFSRLGPDGWASPRTVAEGSDWFVNWADVPSVVPISDSLWAAHWLPKRPGGTYAYDVSVAVSTDQGITWSQGITPHRDGTATEHGFVSLFPWQGGAGIVWLDGRNTQAEGTDHEHGGAGGMTLRSAVVSEHGTLTSEAEIDNLVCDCCNTDVAMTTDGPIAVYRNRSKAEIRDIYVARTKNLQWLPGKPVTDDGWEIAGCPVNGPAIDARGNDVAIAWFTMAEDLPKVRFARSSDGARTFKSVLDIDTDSPLGRVDVVLLPDGRAAVSWLDNSVTREGEILVRIVSSSGQPEALYRIAQTTVTRPAGFPQMAVDGDSLVLAWTNTSGEQTRIQTARIAVAK